jgi:apolipoprotein N-acyltransferase
MLFTHAYPAQRMKPLALALLGAALSVLAFPPFGPGFLVLPGIALFLISVRMVENRRQGLLVGSIYGLAFFGGLMWWLAELELLALILVPVQAAFLAIYGWWLSRYHDYPPGTWLTLAVGGWAVMELIRYHFPVGGLEWGAAGYALSDNVWARQPAAVIGTTGLTIVVVLIAALLAQTFTRASGRATLWGSLIVVLIVAGSSTWWMVHGLDDVGAPVTIVQGSTPCPFEHCPPDERLRTYEQHLELTRNLEPETAGLVVWPEGSTGSTNADPVNNEEIGQAIAEQARRLGSRFVVGGDRVVDDTSWVNANVYFNSEGEIVGEYRKQHPVPFGEYIPWRPLFDWIPALDRVPRDMVRGDGPVLMGEVGSVISFEGGFARYAFDVRRAGAELIVVNTNEASYGETAPTADQFIGMTRMRAVELGVPVIHAAVTGKSTVIDVDGSIGEETRLGQIVALQDSYRSVSISTVYAVIGNLAMWVAAAAGVVPWARLRWVVGSQNSNLMRSNQ